MILQFRNFQTECESREVETASEPQLTYARLRVGDDTIAFYNPERDTWVMEEDGSEWTDVVFIERAPVGDASIFRALIGGADSVTFADFAASVVQDGDTALRVAEWMLANPGKAYLWNEDDAEFYEEFTVIDADRLRAQIEAFKAASA